MNKAELMEKLKLTIDMVTTLTQLHHTLSQQTMDKCVIRQRGLSCGACCYVTESDGLLNGMQLYHPDECSQTCMNIENLCVAMYQEFLCDVQNLQDCRIKEKEKEKKQKKQKKQKKTP